MTTRETTESTPLLLKDEVIIPIEKESETRGNDGSKSWHRTTAALAFSLLVQSYLLVSVFPYSGFLAMHLIPGLNEETAGSYAGLIASSFMAGRTFSSFEWGKAADRYGRVNVIKASLLLSAIFSILFGLAPTFPMALVIRFILGLCNGLIGPVKTLISEYASGDQVLETKMMGIVLGMWGYGFIINPAISGYLSDPVKQYPDAGFVTLFRPLLERFPFFLPNVVGCLFCLTGYFTTHFFVEETLPKEKRKQFRLPSIVPWLKRNPQMMRQVSSWGLFKHLHNSEGENSEDFNIIVSPSKEDREKTKVDSEGGATISSLLQRKSTRQHLLVYWVYSFLVITIDEVFPLFCISKTSGLGITEKVIGNVLSGSGLFYIIVQYLLLTGLVDRFGLYPALRIGAFLSIPLGVFIPLSLITNANAPPGTLSLVTLTFLSVVYASVRSFSSVVFSTITMATNRTVPSHHRATMNGLSMLGGSLAKAIGPLFGGILFSTSANHITPPFGSAVVYGIITLIGLCLGIQACSLRSYEEQDISPTKKITNEQEALDSSSVYDPEMDESPPTF